MYNILNQKHKYNKFRYCTCFIAQWGEHLTVCEVDGLREETVPVSGRSGAQSSVVSTRRQQFKEGVCWM